MKQQFVEEEITRMVEDGNYKSELWIRADANRKKKREKSQMLKNLPFINISSVVSADIPPANDREGEFS